MQELQKLKDLKDLKELEDQERRELYGELFDMDAAYNAFCMLQPLSGAIDLQGIYSNDIAGRPWRAYIRCLFVEACYICYKHRILSKDEKAQTYAAELESIHIAKSGWMVATGVTGDHTSVPYQPASAPEFKSIARSKALRDAGTEA